MVVGIGGTTESGSTTEIALRTALEPIMASGGDVRLFTADALQLPMYNPGDSNRTPAARALIEAVREADGLILASPALHASVSGQVKNVLDYIEDLRDEDPCYFDGRVVGSIGVGRTWQDAVAVVEELRSIVHALRGWNTPYGVVLKDDDSTFADGCLIDSAVRANLHLVGQLCCNGSAAGSATRFTRHTVYESAETINVSG